jgi:colicin import membrane protein
VNFSPSNVMAWTLAILLHAGIIGAFFVDWQPENQFEVSEIQPYYIEASLAVENPHTAKQKREAEQAAARVRQRNAQRRADEAAINKAQKLEADRLKALAAENAKQAAERALQEKAEQEARRLAAESEEVDDVAQAKLQTDLQRLIEIEAGARRAVTDDEKAMAYVAQIQAEIIQNWSRPPSARNGMQALLKVFLVPTGEVVDVTLLESSGNESFDRSALLAVRKAERFQVPDDPRQFERNFREFEVLFRPEDLRL